MRMALLVGELNGLTPLVRDVGNAYLEAYTKEKVYFIAGPEFGELEGCTLVINKALYGLRSGGARLHDRMAAPCKNDEDLWLRDAGDCYEYICVCLLYTSPSPRDGATSRMPSSA